METSCCGSGFLWGMHMTEQFRRELEEWMEFAYNLGALGVRIGDTSADPQRCRLSYCIAREFLVQCKEIEETAGELVRRMQDIAELVENPPNVKTLRR